MRRLLLALLLGLLAAPSYAGDLYYTQAGSDRNVYAVNANGGTPRIVLNGAEYAGNMPHMATWRNHAGSNGQAFLHGTSSASYPNPSELELIYRAPTGAVVTKRVTDLGSAASPFKPYYSGGLAKDDSFFSVRAYDGQGTSCIYKLHVTVDESLAADYVPPNSYTDPRLELVHSGYLDPQTGYFEAFFHDWSGDGSRVPKTATVWTASFGFLLAGAFGWVAEVFGYPGTAGPQGQKGSVALLAGPTFSAREWLALDLGTITPVTGPQPRAAYAGFVWNIGSLSSRNAESKH